VDSFLSFLKPLLLVFNPAISSTFNSSPPPKCTEQRLFTPFPFTLSPLLSFSLDSLFWIFFPLFGPLPPMFSSGQPSLFHSAIFFDSFFYVFSFFFFSYLPVHLRHGPSSLYFIATPHTIFVITSASEGLGPNPLSFFL